MSHGSPRTIKNENQWHCQAQENDSEQEIGPYTTFHSWNSLLKMRSILRHRCLHHWLYTSLFTCRLFSVRNVHPSITQNEVRDLWSASSDIWDS